MKLKLLTFNIHKGFSLFSRSFTLPKLRKILSDTGADIIFLQEVVGRNVRQASRHAEWPKGSQDKYIAEHIGFHHVYGKNMVYTAGHHGNAILSRFPILCSEQVDISTHRFSRRGMLHIRVKPPGAKTCLHCICVHLGLLKSEQKKQFNKILAHIKETVPPQEPLIVAGDFNEWRKGSAKNFEILPSLKDAGIEFNGSRLATFPAILPILPLDRIYLRGFRVLNAETFGGSKWRGLSDHAPFFTEVETLP